MSVIENSTQSIQFMFLNLIPNHRTDKDGGRVDIIRCTHIVVKFFVIFRMKHLWLILFVLLFFSCDDKEQTVDCNIKATLKDYTGMDGCKFVLVLENGGVLEMGDFDEEPNFKFSDGMKVSISYEEMRDMASICMVGPIVRIMCMKTI